MNRDVCTLGHAFRDGDKYCGVCGEDRLGPRTRCPKCGHEDEPGLNFCTQCRSPLVVVGAAASAPAQILPSPFGRNHDVFAAAIAGREGETLGIGELSALVQKVDPSFNMGSFLPNDHARGNRGSCGCSEFKGGAKARPLFKQVARGLYQVINYSDLLLDTDDRLHGVGDSKILRRPESSQVLTASAWLLGPAASRINRVLGNNEPARVIAGQKGGRWISVGKTLPFHHLTTGYRDSWWAIGIDRTFDYELGQLTDEHPIYLGLRLDRNVAAHDGGSIYNALSSILPGSWKEPRMYWPIWSEPSQLDENGRVLNQDSYVETIVSTYVETYAIVHEYLSNA